MFLGSSSLASVKSQKKRVAPRFPGRAIALTFKAPSSALYCFYFNFSATVDIQHYFILVSVHSTVIKH